MGNSYRKPLGLEAAVLRHITPLGGLRDAESSHKHSNPYLVTLGFLADFVLPCPTLCFLSFSHLPIFCFRSSSKNVFDSDLPNGRGTNSSAVVFDRKTLQRSWASVTPDASYGSENCSGRCLLSGSAAPKNLFTAKNGGFSTASSLGLQVYLSTSKYFFFRILSLY